MKINPRKEKAEKSSISFISKLIDGQEFNQAIDEVFEKYSVPYSRCFLRDDGLIEILD